LRLERRTIESIAARFDWQERAAEYNAYIADLMSVRSLESRLELANRHSRVAGKVLEVVERTADKLPFVDGKTMAGLLEAAVKVERQARGETDSAPVMQATAINVSFGAGADGSSRVPLWAQAEAVDSKTIDAPVNSLPSVDAPPARSTVSLSSIIFGAE
jgi:hypothetical protein